MVVSDRDIIFFAKKLNLSPEKTFLLIQDSDCLPEILDKVSQENFESIVDISFPVFVEITIIKYTRDLKYSFEEKEYVSESIGNKFYDLIEQPITQKSILEFKQDEQTARALLVFLGFFYKSLRNPRRAYPSEKIYYNIAKNGFENSNQEQVSKHLQEWIKILRFIHNEAWF